MYADFTWENSCCQSQIQRQDFGSTANPVSEKSQPAQGAIRGLPLRLITRFALCSTGTIRARAQG